MSTQPIRLRIQEEKSRLITLYRFFNKNILARAATIIPLAAPFDDYQFPYVLRHPFPLRPFHLETAFDIANHAKTYSSFSMFFDGFNIHSSLVASRAVQDDMLRFAAHHNVKPVTETFEFSEEGLGQCLGRMKEGKLRYRGVLVR